MKIIRIFILKQFLLTFFLAMLFFILILEIGDMFPNLDRYSANEVGLIQILTNMYYYIPKCISFAVPISLIFSVAFTIGTLYMNNELITVFGSGISLKNFVMPIIITGIIISALMFVFNEEVVISSFNKKMEYTELLLKKKPSYSNQNVAEIGDSQDIVYSADYYNDNNISLTGVTIIEYDKDFNFIQRVDADYAEWSDEYWLLHRARLFHWDENREYLTEKYYNEYKNENYNILPDRFRRITQNVDNMTISEAKAFIEQMRNASPDVRRQIMTNYHEKFSYAFAPLIVVIISCAVGGKFKKNILLFSLAASLTIAVIYEVLRMFAMLLAKQGYISPFLGAWMGTIIISMIIVGLYRVART